MIKDTLKVAIALTVALSLTGCATVGGYVNDARDWLSDPRTQVAFNTLQVGTRVFVCNIAAQASLAQQIEAAVKAKQVVYDTTGEVVAVASIVCNSLQGIAVPATVTGIQTSPTGPVIQVGKVGQ